MTEAVETALDQFVGRGAEGERPDPNDVADLAHRTRAPLVSWDASGSAALELARQGYTHTRRFVLLPSRKAPRWLLPLDDVQRTLEALEMYQPYSAAARIFKRLLSGAIKVGWTGWARPRLLIASAKPLPLESLVSDLTGERQPVFGLSLGTATRYRKLSIQVMRRNGGRLGYLKLPLTEAATSRVRHEADMLERLWPFPTLRPHIPKLLYAGEWGDGYILFQSCGPAGRSPLTFGNLHKELLRTLWSCWRTEKPGSQLVQEVAARWRQAESMLDAEWQDLGRMALAEANLKLDGTQIRCGIMHGDFMPTNIRVEDGRAFLFDWESASWQGPILWDVFHFHVQAGSAPGKTRGNGMVSGHPIRDRASFMLYVLNSVCQLLEEGSPGTKAAVQYRRRLLVSELAALRAKASDRLTSYAARSEAPSAAARSYER